MHPENRLLNETEFTTQTWHVSNYQQPKFVDNLVLNNQ